MSTIRKLFEIDLNIAAILMFTIIIPSIRIFQWINKNYNSRIYSCIQLKRLYNFSFHSNV